MLLSESVTQRWTVAVNFDDNGRRGDRDEKEKSEKNAAREHDRGERSNDETIDYIIVLGGIRSNLKEQQLSPRCSRSRSKIRMCLFSDERKN
jgi:hypothetical protein